MNNHPKTMHTKSQKLFTLFAAFLSLALLASACGGDSASAGDQEVIDALVQSIDNEAEFPESVDVDCLASGMVSSLGGAEQMESEWGLTAATILDGQDVNDIELPKAQAISMADTMMDCGLVNAMIGEFAGDEMSEDDAKCLVGSLDQDALRDTFAAEFMNDAEADEVGEAAEQAMFTSMFSAIADCEIDPSSLGL